ncbi:MAG: hypothetical protein ACAH80_06840 [Alphaproteobacteria bacterium]
MQGTTDPLRLLEVKDKASFDFKAAALRTRADFPKQSRNMLIINAADGHIDDPGGLMNWLLNTEWEFHLGGGIVVNNVGSLLFEMGEDSMLVKMRNGISLLNLGPDSLADSPFFAGIPTHLRARYVFEHELGHAVVDGGQGGYRPIKETDFNSPQSEESADGFGLLRTLQDHGEEAAALAHAIGLFRIDEMIKHLHTDHMTTIVVDKIIMDAKTVDFRSLKPEETQQLAADYSRRFRLGDDDILDIMSDFYPLHDEIAKLSAKNTRPLEHLAAIVTADYANPYTVYLGARMLKHFMMPGGQEFKGGLVRLDGPEWEERKVRIAAAIERIPANHVLRQLDLPTITPDIRHADPDSKAAAFNGVAPPEAVTTGEAAAEKAPVGQAMQRPQPKP